MKFCFILIFNIFIHLYSNKSESLQVIYKNYFDSKNSSVNTFNEAFNKFKLLYNKSYALEEESIVKLNFIKSFKHIVKHNQLFLSGDMKHELGINQFSDMSIKEINRRKLQKTNMKIKAQPKSSLIDESNLKLKVGDSNNIFDLPLSFDWRQLNKVTKVKDQKKCKACYAFTVTSTIESAIAIRNNFSIDLLNLSYFTNNDDINGSPDLSEQQLIDCTNSGKYHNHGCNYGFIEDTFQYVIDNGVVADNEYPYIDEQSLCQQKSNQNRTFVYKYESLSHPTEHEIKQIVYNLGPVIALMNDEGSDFLFYNRGIITTGNKLITGHYFNHAVCIIGWGQQNNTKYWIIKNSWSQSWGENGFARIAMGVRGIDSYIYYPVLFDDNPQTSDIYYNILIYVFIVVAILMFCSILIFYIICCNKRGKCVYFTKFKVPKYLKVKPKPQNLIQPDILQNNNNINI